ncbi:MAG: hypothetical protein WKF75_01250, partial [Singulisphaera sp.]
RGLPMLNRNRNPIKAGVLASVTALAGMLGTVSSSLAQGTPPVAKPSIEPKTKGLNVTPRAAPMPALRYRLLPLEPERTPGDAAPIYLRLWAGITEESRRELREKPIHWLDEPLDQFPVAEARKFVDMWGNRLEQMEFGARRQTCNWNYTLPEQRERSINILLPDAQESRSWVRLLTLKARVEIAERKDDDAIRTLETGLAFSRHLADGPFLINELVGIGSAHLMLDRVEELIVQPDAPNLYWSLTALPRPLIDVRRAMETEQKLGEWLIPEITELDRSRTEAEWASLLVRLHARIRDLEKMFAAGDPVAGDTAPNPGVLKTPDLAKFKAELLPEARRYTKERRGPIEGMPDDQALILFIAGRYRDLRDEQFKPTYIPFPDAFPLYAGSSEQIKAIKGGPLGIFAWLPSRFIMQAHMAEARLDRRVAALRVVEALRLDLAAKPGPLPGALDHVTIVPIPPDPVTGKAFEYHREGEAAILVGPTSSLADLGISYRITLRK